ncbi:hypothetical protein [Micromonospora sp. NPDC005171]|uniref:hypothetical protein n=1 Tax=Micromonospora sp. NPDC005171 TaxID=3156866 RepID=UPI0033B0A90C
MAESSRPQPYQPGAVSLFFVAKAGVFAAAFWIWLLVLVLRTDSATGLQVLAASGTSSPPPRPTADGPASGAVASGWRSSTVVPASAQVAGIAAATANGVVSRCPRVD